MTWGLYQSDWPVSVRTDRWPRKRCDVGPDTFVLAAGPGGHDVITDFIVDDSIAVIGLVDEQAPGLHDDLVRTIISVEQAQPGGRVEVEFDHGAVVSFAPVGISGAIDSISDPIGPAQVLAADPLLL